MNASDEIKLKITHLYRTNPQIHVSVCMPGQRIQIQNEEAIIVALYPNIFQVTSHGKRYTLQYTDVLTKNVVITELS